MKALIFHLLFCSLLFLDNHSYQQKNLKRFFKRSPTSSWVKVLQKKLAKDKYNIPKIEQAILLALTTGKKTKLRKTLFYSKLQKAQMLHLLTPSGLHLSSLLILVLLCFRKSLYRQIIFTTLSPFIFSLNGFDAAKRVFSLKLVSLFGIPVKIAFYTIFAIAFLMKPNLSVLLSFLFIGVLILNPYKTYLSQISFLSLAQMITCLYFEQAYYIYSFWLNTLGSLYITLSFPIIIMTMLFPVLYSYSTQYILEGFYQIISLIESSPRLF